MNSEVLSYTIPDIDSYTLQSKDSDKCSFWYVMRDLKRANAKLPAYKLLQSMSFKVFTPMKYKLSVKKGKRIQEKVPFMQDLLFVHAYKDELDSVVDTVNTLQYRFIRGAYCEPMIVSDKEMELFIKAVESTDTPQYFLPGELTPSMYGRKICIVGGPLDGYVGTLLTTRGSRKKRLIVEIPSLLSVAVEVNPEYIKFV